MTQFFDFKYGWSGKKQHVPETVGSKENCYPNFEPTLLFQGNHYTIRYS